MKKVYIIVLIIIVTIIIGVCGASAIKTKKANSTQTDKTLSYESFQNVFKELNTNFKVDDYELRGKSVEQNLIGIDKPLSFDKRSLLTIDGTQKSGETQERIIFENDKNKSIILVDLIFLKEFIGSDLIYLNSLNPYDVKNKSILNNFNSAMISYKNLIVKITILGDQDNSDKVLFSSITNIQKILITSEAL